MSRAQRETNRLVTGQIIHINRYGSLVTNIHRSLLDGFAVTRAKVGEFPVALRILLGGRRRPSTGAVRQLRISRNRLQRRARRYEAQDGRGRPGIGRGRTDWSIVAIASPLIASCALHRRAGFQSITELLSPSYVSPTPSGRHVSPRRGSVESALFRHCMP